MLRDCSLSGQLRNVYHIRYRSQVGFIFRLVLKCFACTGKIDTKLSRENGKKRGKEIKAGRGSAKPREKE